MRIERKYIMVMFIAGILAAVNTVAPPLTTSARAGVPTAPTIAASASYPGNELEARTPFGNTVNTLNMSVTFTKDTGALKHYVAAMDYPSVGWIIWAVIRCGAGGAVAWITAVPFIPVMWARALVVAGSCILAIP